MSSSTSNVIKVAIFSVVVNLPHQMTDVVMMEICYINAAVSDFMPQTCDIWNDFVEGM